MNKSFVSIASVIITLVLTITTVYASVNTVETRKSQIIQLPTVVIDAGHGGFDGGCVGVDGTYEKDINLIVSKVLEELLNELGFNTVMVRTDDVSVDTEGRSIREKKRSDIKNRFSLLTKYPGCVYLSIHQNQYSSQSAWGAQVFYTPGNDKSYTLSKKLQENIVNGVQPGNKRKVKVCTKDVYIIHYAPMQSTAVLVECGFLSNNKDLLNLKNTEYQNRLCFAIACGVLDWIKESE